MNQQTDWTAEIGRLVALVARPSRPLTPMWQMRLPDCE